MPDERIVVIIPTYNEQENLELIVCRVRTATPDVDVLVVDDASPDGTGALAESMAAQDAQVHVLHRAGKEGLGAAYLAGFAWAREHGYDIVVEMDADGSHQPEQLSRLLRALDDADIVLGSRWVPGGDVVNWPKSREVLSRGGNWYVRLMLGVDVRDATGGFRAIRLDALDRLGLDEIRSQGYCFQVDVVRRAVSEGLRIREVPIEFVERVRGESKMSGGIVREALWRVSVWGVQDRTEKARSRIAGTKLRR